MPCAVESTRWRANDEGDCLIACRLVREHTLSHTEDQREILKRHAGAVTLLTTNNKQRKTQILNKNNDSYLPIVNCHSITRIFCKHFLHCNGLC